MVATPSFYGPHIGITDDGEPGRMRRVGQTRLTNSWSLDVGLERFGVEEMVWKPTYCTVDYDYQQMMLESMMPFKHQILIADNPKRDY